MFFESYAGLFCDGVGISSIAISVQHVGPDAILPISAEGSAFGNPKIGVGALEIAKGFHVAIEEKRVEFIFVGGFEEIQHPMATRESAWIEFRSRETDRGLLVDLRRHV